MPTLLQSTLPDPEFREHHERSIDAPPAAVWDVLSTLRVDQLGVTRPLVALRGLAAPRRRPSRPLFEEGPVRLVVRDAPAYALGGQVARPWQPRPEHREVTTLDELATFDEPGWTVFLVDFRLEPQDGGTLLSTETRGRSTDAHARRRFALYWALIRPGSGLVRRDILATVARLAERRG